MKPTPVLFTIDTEFSIGGHFQNASLNPLGADRMVFCRYGGKDYGIGLIMDALDRNGLRGVFFLETESRFHFGSEPHKRIIAAIRERGHEVQLHLHCGFRNFIGERGKELLPDEIGAYPLDRQIDIIGEAKSYLEANGSNPIRGFRAGSFGADESTIQACLRNGIRFLSNGNPSSRNCGYMRAYPDRIHPLELPGGAMEFPVTNFRESGGRKEWSPFQICAASASEMIKGSLHYRKLGLPLINILTHSFEFVKGRGPQRAEISPRRITISRLNALCDFYGERKDAFRPVTISDFEGMDFSEGEVIPAYRSPLLDVAARYALNFLGDL